jgi:hypothetical protein
MADHGPESQERPPKAEETSERATQRVELSSPSTRVLE